MQPDQYMKQFAEATAAAFRSEWPEVFAELGEVQAFSSDFVLQHLEKPKDPKMGRFAFPVFRMAGILKERPPDIALKICDRANELLGRGDRSLLICEAAAGFINAQVNATALAEETLNGVLSAGNAFGSSNAGAGKTMLVEYSSANIAKPFGIAHLRSTVIGNSLRRVFKKLGYDAVGINYLGDWGTQFGKMIVAYRMWGRDLKLDSNALNELVKLYVRFHDEAEKNPELDDRARQAFKDLEDGEPEAIKLWETFRSISLAEFDQIYEILGVEFDWVTGEAFLNDKMEAAIERFSRSGLTSQSQGALVIDLKDDQLPPLLLKKADGATLYATRELAGLLYRWQEYKFHEALYVVGSAQADHFRQTLKAIDLLELAEGVPETELMSPRVKHVDFGWVRFGDRKMSTRKGDIVFLEDVYQTATTKVREIIAKKNPDLADSDEVALMIGVGAVIFAQLSVRRQKDVNLQWEDILSFEGETGPYLQYTHARLCSLERNYPEAVLGVVDFALLDREEEHRLIELLADFPVAVQDAARIYDPQIIAACLLRLAGAFNKFYQRKGSDGRVEKIISADARLSAARMALVKAVRLVMNEGLYLLGLRAPIAM
ncbi:MAG: arginine--tRNA ligase [bacterium]